MAIRQEYSPERMADRAQIRDVMYRWCRAVDRLDYDAIRTVFHPDGIDSHGAYNGNIDGLIEWIRGRHATIPFSMHSISNMLIEFAGQDIAIVETYVFVVQRYPPEAKGSVTFVSKGGGEGKSGVAMDLMICARYVDRFERRHDEWRILHRTVVFDSVMPHEVAENGPEMGKDWTLGQRDHTDHIYQARAKVGLQS
jgi:hypothetical protein